MSKEAMKLAMEALEYIEHNYMSLPAPAEKAITSLREALAEQPAQQEPFGFAVMENPIAPPAQRQWLGLTPEQAVDLYKATETDNRMVLIDAVEAKLKEKNT